jgi:glutamine synthetase
MLRIPEGGRVENRCVDGSANPYLAISALIAAGMDGVERGVDPGGPCELDLLRLSPHELEEQGLVAMPPSLWHALEQLEDDDALRAGLGKTPAGDYVDYFITTKRSEYRAAQAQVTPWVIDRYLSAI